jgi:hypothetical protein
VVASIAFAAAAVIELMSPLPRYRELGFPLVLLLVLFGNRGRLARQLKQMERTQDAG